jgi:hypothetical protein
MEIRFSSLYNALFTLKVSILFENQSIFDVRIFIYPNPGNFSKFNQNSNEKKLYLTYLNEINMDKLNKG